MGLCLCMGDIDLVDICFVFTKDFFNSRERGFDVSYRRLFGHDDREFFIYRGNRMVGICGTFVALVLVSDYVLL